jgi:hypothetical protein
MGKAATVDEELLEGLKTAKTKPCRFALVEKGTTDGALIITKTQVPPVLISAAKKKCGGTTVIKGIVSFDDGHYIFETGKPPAATLAQQIKLLAKRDTGMAIQLECRLSTDPALLAEEGHEPDGHGSGSASSTATSQSAAKAPAVQPSASGGAAQKKPDAALEGRFRERLKALAAATPQAIKLAPAEKPALDHLLHGAMLAETKGLFDQGLLVLDKLEAAIKAANSSATHEKFNARFKALTPGVKQALAAPSGDHDALKRLVNAAQSAAQGNDFLAANRDLDEVERLLGKSGGDRAPSPAVGDFLPKWKAARQAWRVAGEAVDGQIEQLRQALLKTGDAELKEIAEYGINGVTGNFKVPLMAAMIELDGHAANPGPAAAKVRTIAINFQKHLESEDTVAACDENPFGVHVSIRKTLGAALVELQTVLHAV